MYSIRFILTLKQIFHFANIHLFIYKVSIIISWTFFTLFIFVNTVLMDGNKEREKIATTANGRRRWKKDSNFRNLTVENVNFIKQLIISVTKVLNVHFVSFGFNDI